MACFYSKLVGMSEQSIALFTIGFTGKPAAQFFDLLKLAGVRKVIDTRRWPDTQLSGFAKKKDLPFFLKNLAGIEYEHQIELAPSADILRDYKDKKIAWADYEKRYLQLLADRKIATRLSPDDIAGACFLCAEHQPHHCHRRLLVEHLQHAWQKIKITVKHL